jgi:hypothetical protein
MSYNIPNSIWAYYLYEQQNFILQLIKVGNKILFFKD